MKKIIFALMVILSAGMANAQSKFFEECGKIEGVTTVYVGSMMMRMVSGQIGNMGDKFDLPLLADKINSLEIIQAPAGEAAKKVESIASKLGVGKGYELLMMVNDNGSKMRILYKNLGNDKNEYLMISPDVSELTYIIITGSLSPQDVKANR